MKCVRFGASSAGIHWRNAHGAIMQQTTNGHPQAVTDADFAAQVEGASELVLVDFGASWCGPCRMMEPTVEALATEYAGRVKAGTGESDTNPPGVTRYDGRRPPP